MNVSLPASQTLYEEISSLSYALDVTTSKGTATLLDASIQNTNILNAFVKRYYTIKYTMQG